MSSTRPVTAQFIDHNSEATHYIHPYLFTHESETTGEVYVWSTLGNASEPVLCATLEEAMLDPREHHLIGPDRILSITTLPESYKLSEILVHSLPDGDNLDRLMIGPVDSSGPGSNSMFLGLNGKNIAVWRNTGAGGGRGVIEIYSLSKEGKLVGKNTLMPPPGSETLESTITPGEFYPPETIHISENEVIVVRMGLSAPSNIEVARWALESSPDRHAIATFPFLTPAHISDNNDMRSALSDYVHIASHHALVMAHYEFPEEDYDPDPTSAIRCLDPTTLALKWAVALNEVTTKVRYSERLDALIVIGVPSQKSERHVPLSISVLDPSTGAIRAAHIVNVPEKPCGPVFREENGVAVDLTASGEEIVVVFGDGQSNVVSIEEFVANGFPTVEDGSARTATSPFPAIGVSVPSAPEHDEELKRELWHWVKRVFFGEKTVYLQSKRGKDFAALSWK